MIMESADKSKFEYDVVSGVSAGSINALAVSLFEKGKEEEMVEFLSEAWGNLTDSRVYQRWPEGFAEGIMKESGIYNDEPLYNYLNGLIKKYGGPKRKLEISTVDAVTGSYVSFNESVKDPARATVSSSSMPFIFPHQVWKQPSMVDMDGGTVWNVNLVKAVSRCREQVSDDSQITIDIFLTITPLLVSYEFKENTIQNYLRKKAIGEFYKLYDDVVEFKRAFPNINFRYLVMPSEIMQFGLKTIDFSYEHTWPIQLLGRIDGSSAVV